MHPKHLYGQCYCDFMKYLGRVKKTDKMDTVYGPYLMFVHGAYFLCANILDADAVWRVMFNCVVCMHMMYVCLGVHVCMWGLMGCIHAGILSVFPVLGLQHNEMALPLPSIALMCMRA